MMKPGQHLGNQPESGDSCRKGGTLLLSLRTRRWSFGQDSRRPAVTALKVTATSSDLPVGYLPAEKLRRVAAVQYLHRKEEW